MTILNSTNFKVSGIFGSDNSTSLPDFELELVEELGVSLPVLVLTFRMVYIKNILTEVVKGKKISVIQESSSYDFEIIHYQMLDEQKIQITCILSALDFITKSVQSSYKGTSTDAASTIKSIPVVIDTPSVVPTDSQVWIQDNVSDRDFLVDTLTHSFIQDDVLLFYVSKAKKIHVASYSELIKTSNLEYGRDKSDVGIHEILIESIPASFRLQCLSSQYSSVQTLSADNYDGVETSSQSNIFRVFFDCGNTHSKYNEAYNNFNQSYSNLFDRVMFLISKNNTLVKPLDVLKITSYPAQFDSSNYPDLLNLNYVVNKVVTKQSEGVISQRIYFSRMP